MSTIGQQSVDKSWVEDFISTARLSAHLAQARGDIRLALNLYADDLDAVAELHVWINIFEVSLRNAIVRELTGAAQRRGTDWIGFLEESLTHEGLIHLNKARARLANKRQGYPSAALVARLSLGFWVNLFRDLYETTLWTPALHRAFPNLQPRKRGVAYARISNIYSLRNHIAHQGLISRGDLAMHRETISEALRWISIAGRDWAVSTLTQRYSS